MSRDKGRHLVKISNLQKNTTESQVYELVSSCGIIHRIFMDSSAPTVNSNYTSCVVEFMTQKDAQQCFHFVNNTHIQSTTLSAQWLTLGQSRQYQSSRDHPSSSSSSSGIRSNFNVEPIWTEEDAPSSEQLLKCKFTFHNNNEYSLPSLDRFFASSPPVTTTSATTTTTTTSNDNDDETNNVENTTTTVVNKRDELIKEKLLRIRNDLNQSKARFEGVNFDAWNRHAFMMNPVASVPKELKIACNAEMCTRGWIKMFEFLKTTPHMMTHILQNSSHNNNNNNNAAAATTTTTTTTTEPQQQQKIQLNSLHLCEAPGGFICALNHFLKTEYNSSSSSSGSSSSSNGGSDGKKSDGTSIDWQWFANSLSVSDENSLYDMRMVRETESHWLYGVDKTGDITNSTNIEHMWNTIVEQCATTSKTTTTSDQSKLDKNHPVMIVTADGGVKVSDDPYDQENILASLKFAEITAALGILGTGGSFIIKFLTLLEPISISMLYLLNCVFESVTITKPVTTKSSSSEVYAVCVGFRGIDQSYLTKMLQHVGPLFSTKVPFIALSDMPDDFMEQVEQQAKYFADQQKESIEQKLSLFDNMSREERARVIQVRDINTAMFLKKFEVKRLRDEDRIVPKKPYQQPHLDSQQQQQQHPPHTRPRYESDEPHRYGHGGAYEPPQSYPADDGEYYRPHKRARRDEGGGRYGDYNPPQYPPRDSHYGSNAPYPPYGSGGQPEYYNEEQHGGGDRYGRRAEPYYSGGAPPHHPSYPDSRRDQPLQPEPNYGRYQGVPPPSYGRSYGGGRRRYDQQPPYRQHPYDRYADSRREGSRTPPSHHRS